MITSYSGYHFKDILGLELQPALVKEVSRALAVPLHMTIWMAS